MDKAYEHKYNQLSEKHCWFVARRKLILGLMKQYHISPEQNILEIGCGWGALINELNTNNYHNTYGIDISEEAVEHCRSQRIKNILKMDVAKMEFDSNYFDLIIASDVLEHIEDEDSALREVYRVLKKDGVLIILVPAFGFLWSGHDVINSHFRRYTKSELSDCLRKNKFLVDKSSYWNANLFFPVLLIKFVKKVFSVFNDSSPKDEFYTLNPVLNKLILWILNMENKIILKLFNLPLGVSVFSVAKK